MSIIPTKDLVYLIILLLAVLGMVWWHHDAVMEGEAKCIAAQQKAIVDQRIKDAKASQDAILELQQDKIRLQSQLDAKPPPVIHCRLQRYVDRPLQPGTTPTRAQPDEPADGSANTGVLERSSGGDVGAGMLAIAAAGELNALYRQRLYDWSVKTR